MAKTSTLTEVANFALTKLGERSGELLTDINTDTSDNAGVCRQFMEITIRTVQANYYWDELIKRVTLATPADDLTEDVNYDWAYRYTLPTDYLAPLYNEDMIYEVEGGYVYCNWETDFLFQYRSFDDTPSVWDSQLLNAIIFELAIAICMPITENDKKHAKIIQEYEVVVLPRLERSASYGKKYPNNRRKHTLWGLTRGGGTRRYGRRLF